MTDIKVCQWCKCVGCSTGECCTHGKFREDGTFNPSQPHRLAVKVVNGQEAAFGGTFIVEDLFGNMYRWKIDYVQNPAYTGLPHHLMNRILGRAENPYDIYPEKAELTRAFGDPL